MLEADPDRQQNAGGGEGSALANGRSIDRAAEDARRWVSGMGPCWVARFDQMHSEVRRWAQEVGVDPVSYEFRAVWCVATTFLHHIARLMDEDDPMEADRLAHTANILASVGLWGGSPDELG
jgi:hypothetical protein